VHSRILWEQYRPFITHNQVYKLYRSEEPGIAAMKLAIVFCALTALLSLSARAQGSPSSGIQIETSDAPSFCNDLDCPPYTVEETLDGGIELRSYKAGKAPRQKSTLDWL
jgi:hypothetical protein